MRNASVTTTPTPHDDESWSSILKRAKQARASNHQHLPADKTSSSRVDSSLSSSSFMASFGKYMERWNDQMDRYLTEIGTTPWYFSNKNNNSNKNNSSLDQESRKRLILETRSALRFGIYCLSCGGGGDNDANANVDSTAAAAAAANDERETLQIFLVMNCQWHCRLAALLSSSEQHQKEQQQIQGEDGKCRVLAARLLSNLVTANDRTAKQVSQCSIDLSPSQSQVQTAVRHDQQSVDNSHESFQSDTCTIIYKPNWVDMLISSSRAAFKGTAGLIGNTNNNREALAGIVAALHNSLMALHEPDQCRFATQCASNDLLMSTLLRQFLSIHSIQPAATGVPRLVDEDHGSDWDSATEWIAIFLGQLIHLDLLVTMYRSIGPTTTTGASSSTSFSTSLSNTSVVPEQALLMHFAAHHVKSSMEDFSKSNSSSSKSGTSWISSLSNHEFLANLFCRYGCVAAESNDDNDNDDKVLLPKSVDFDDGTDALLGRSVALASAEILAIILGLDDNNNNNNNNSTHHTTTFAEIRQHLGTTTQLLSTACVLLGHMVNELSDRSQGLKARELKLSSQEQTWMIVLVRLLGNLCFECRVNQDMMRTIQIPTAATRLNHRDGDNIQAPTANNNDATEAETSPPRVALHILLSCTSFSTSCFALREWCVVAIRNILENNQLNQQVVERLHAQDAVPSVAMENAGVRVNLDEHGKVCLTPIVEEE